MSSTARRLHVPSDLHRRTVDWVRGSQGGIIATALVVGAGGGLGAIAFRDLIRWFTIFFTGHDDYSAAGHAINPNVPWLGIYFVILAPILGGLIYGPLIQFFAPEARGHGVPEVMFAVAERGGKIRPQVAVVKSLASAICIGAGGSVGREGPIVQIGSALGSSIGQALHVSEARLSLLVACGTAAGISATFNAPIAGVFFALELILQDFAVDAFGAVVLASVVADVIGRAAFGSQAFLTLPAFHIVSTWEFGLYAVLGVLGGFAGLAFIRVLYGTEDLLDRIWHGPEWLRPMAGGVLLGTPAAGTSRTVWRRVSGAPERCRRRGRSRASPALARRQDACYQPNHRHRRIGRRLRAVAIHGRDAGNRLRRGRQYGVPRCRGTSRCIRSGGHGGGLRRCGSGTDHGRDHHL